MCVSTMKYFSPFFSYKRPPLLVPRGDEVEAEVLGGVLGVGEHDGPVVLVDHPAVVRRHVLLEFGGVEEAWLLTERLGDLVVDDVHPPGRVDPDHGRQVPHLHVRLGGHDLRDNGADLVVHQREAALVGRRVVRLERALGGFERGHWASSFGTSRCRSVTIPANRLLAASRPSSKRGGFWSGCDHSGCILRAACSARGTQSVSHPLRTVLLWSANSRSVARSSNIARV